MLEGGGLEKNRREKQNWFGSERVREVLSVRV